MLRTANASSELAAPRTGFDLTLGPGVTGLVGRNGSGKSSLLKFIAGSIGTIDTGDLSVTGPVTGEVSLSGPVSGPARLLDQSPDPALRLCDLFGCTEAWADLKRALAGEATLGTFDAVDWTLEDRMVAQLNRFGLSEMTPERHLGTLSGGQQLRAALAALFFDPPEILLLDEPTNALDTEAREGLAEALKAHRGLALIASHDRALLEEMDRIVSLEPDGSVAVFGGGWSVFHAARETERARLETEAEKAGRALRQHQAQSEEAAARQARRARQGRALRDGSQSKMLLDKAKEGAEGAAGGRLRASARRGESLLAAQTAVLKRIERVTPVAMAFPQISLPASKQVLDLHDAVFAVGGHRIGPITLTITGPQRLALLGPNGAGKSTLLRGIAGEIAPLSGEVHRPVTSARLDQTGGLEGPGSLLDAAQAEHPNLAPSEIRSALAQAGFRGDAALKPAKVLSGGERLRAAIALLGAGSDPAPLLLLDEPTNHLDLDALEALEVGLTGWRGALIVVSHDAHFLRKLDISETFCLKSRHMPVMKAL
ncbi:ABC-F family ATP-binding cassette domain-containing protein [Celeribacter persicus]|uniref:ATPase subunit of ABC transporter with duplicated ATPase domains n=1 Tax=Celeribacter persicus TaxID=1651082 RepID=A0A2T5HU99_9RHOB|nr:ABC-F family ATP-binding cassette domain-containing protein [Celeribacter persicus]PTQ75162.1 ATPase subunit of ABC transporter with duplicated ATPase domains [Celeribacter persicus]